MKEIIAFIFITLLFFPFQNVAVAASPTGTTLGSGWTSKNSDDIVTIQNGTGLPIVITINVADGETGINVRNCGSTTHIDAGSTAICGTTDATNPVNFSSESNDKPASGTYQIQQSTYQ